MPPPYKGATGSNIAKINKQERHMVKDESSGSQCLDWCAFPRVAALPVPVRAGWPTILRHALVPMLGTGRLGGYARALLLAAVLDKSLGS